MKPSFYVEVHSLLDLVRFVESDDMMRADHPELPHVKILFQVVGLTSAETPFMVYHRVKNPNDPARECNYLEHNLVKDKVTPRKEFAIKGDCKFIKVIDVSIRGIMWFNSADIW